MENVFDTENVKCIHYLDTNSDTKNDTKIIEQKNLGLSSFYPNLNLRESNEIENNLAAAFDDFEKGTTNIWEDNSNKFIKSNFLNGILQIPKGYKMLQEHEIVKYGDYFASSTMIAWYLVDIVIGKRSRELPFLVIRKV